MNYIANFVSHLKAHLFVNFIHRSLTTANELTKLDLSNNSRITQAAHGLVSKLSQLKELDLTGCDLLIAQNELNLPFCRLTLSSTFCGNEFYEAPYNYITNSKEIIL